MAQAKEAMETTVEVRGAVTEVRILDLREESDSYDVCLVVKGEDDLRYECHRWARDLGPCVDTVTKAFVAGAVTVQGALMKADKGVVSVEMNSWKPAKA